jgi:hypothetical protein
VTKREVRFSLNSNEGEIAEKITSISKNLGYSTHVTRSKVGNSSVVSITSRVLARAFDAWCGHRAFYKRIPDFLLCHKDLKLLDNFLMGYLGGDFHSYTKRSRRSKGYVSCSTVSRTLAEQLQLAHARLGVWSNVAVRDESTEAIIMGRRVRLHPKYSVTHSLEPNPKRRRVVFLPDKILTPIRSISKSTYEGVVHNLGTTDNTYLVSNAVVHNCGRRFPTDIQLSMHTKLHYLV